MREEGSPFARQAMRAKEKLRAEMKMALKPLQGTKVVMTSKRKQVEVRIDRRTVDHIANDVAEGKIPRLPKNHDEIARLFASAKRISPPSDADRNGEHSKPANVSQFQYYEFKYGGVNLYANIMVKQSNKTNGQEAGTHRLHSITKTIKTKE